MAKIFAAVDIEVDALEHRSPLESNREFADADQRLAGAVRCHQKSIAP
jgi:hypothetical protein